MNHTMTICAVALAVLGVLSIYSAGMARPDPIFHSSWKAHAAAAGFGFVLYFAMAAVDYRKLSGVVSICVYVVSAVLLAAVLMKGNSIYGGRRWLWFFQPSEIAKIAVLAMLADFCSRKELKKGFKSLVCGLLLLAIPVLLILVEPDLGTAMVLLPAGVVVLLASRICNKVLVPVLLAGVLAGVAVTGIVAYAAKAPDKATRDRILKYVPLKKHQVRRLEVFIYPDRDIHGAGYNRRQAEISVGSGGFSGRGFMKGEQNLWGYLPPSVSMNDFIFAVFAEEEGFAGAMLVLALYMGILFPALKTGFKCGDDFGRLLCTGVSILLFLHVYINVAMNIGLMPITGLPLPFMSYGRTFMTVVMVSLGIVQSVAVRENMRDRSLV